MRFFGLGTFHEYRYVGTATPKSVFEYCCEFTELLAKSIFPSSTSHVSVFQNKDSGTLGTRGCNAESVHFPCFQSWKMSTFDITKYGKESEKSGKLRISHSAFHNVESAQCYKLGKWSLFEF